MASADPPTSALRTSGSSAIFLVCSFDIMSVRDTAEVGDTGTDRDVELWSIQSALDRLPEEQRLAVALVLVEGLSYREAAQVMEVPIGTLTSRLARGRMALQSMLADPPPTQVHGEG